MTPYRIIRSANIERLLYAQPNEQSLDGQLGPLVDAHARDILLHIAAHLPRPHVAQQTIADRARVSDDTIRRRVRVWEEIGLLTTRGFRDSSIWYRFAHIRDPDVVRALIERAERRQRGQALGDMPQIISGSWSSLRPYGHAIHDDKLTMAQREQLQRVDELTGKRWESYIQYGPQRLEGATDRFWSARDWTVSLADDDCSFNGPVKPAQLAGYFAWWLNVQRAEQGEAPLLVDWGKLVHFAGRLPEEFREWDAKYGSKDDQTYKGSAAFGFIDTVFDSWESYSVIAPGVTRELNWSSLNKPFVSRGGGGC